MTVLNYFLLTYSAEPLYTYLAINTIYFSKVIKLKSAKKGN